MGRTGNQIQDLVIRVAVLERETKALFRFTDTLLKKVKKLETPMEITEVLDE